MTKHFGAIVLAFILFSVINCGCQRTYYAVWEKLGKEKRHLLRDQVEKARSDQQEASEQFKDVLNRIKQMYGFEGGEIEEFYNRLKSDYEESERRAEALVARIKKVEQIATDLFREWEGEIAEINNEGLKLKSKKSLKATEERFARLRLAMTKAESSMEPVLKRLKDYVLYLKHNLNAQAIGALKREAGDIEMEVGRLINDMGKSIDEADRFLQSLD
jgi:F0F1-type ATP synthase membrane subunit b/b'